MKITFMEIQELRAIKDKKGYVVGPLGNARTFDEALIALQYTTLVSDAQVALNLNLEKYPLSNPIVMTNEFGKQINIIGSKSSHVLDTSVQAVSINHPLNTKIIVKVTTKLPASIVGLGCIIRNNNAANRGTWLISERIDDYTFACLVRGSEIDSNAAGSVDILTTIEIDNQNCLVLNGKDLGLLDNVVLNCISTAGAVKSGIFCSRGLVTCGQNVGVRGFDYGFYAESTGLIEAEKTSASNCKVYGYYATYGGVIDATDTVIGNNVLDYFQDYAGIVIPYAMPLSHTHLNLAILNAIDTPFTVALKAGYDAAVLAIHSHANMVALNAVAGVNTGDQVASTVPNDSSVPGASVKDALNALAGGGSPAVRWWDIQPKDGKVLPISQPRAYYTAVLYNATPMFFDGTALRKYVAYYGGAASAQAYAAFSNDGITWDTETLLTGILGIGYHASTIIVGGIIHYFYWDTTGSLYRPQSIRHATFNPGVSCVAAVSDAPLTGTYITGLIADGLRYGTYGADQLFYNPAPTNSPANPYSYAWCMIHSGVGTTTNEGCLFATSTDGYNFSAWNGLNEVIPRGVSPAWDLCIGRMYSWIDTAGLRHAFYSGGLGTGLGEDTNFGGGLGYATSVDGITWTKWDKNPLIRKTESLKTWKRIYCPWVIYDGAYKVYFTGKSYAGIYITAYATFGGFV